MFQLVASKSKSTPSKSPNELNHRRPVNFSMVITGVVLGTVTLLCLGVFWIYDIFQKSSDVSNVNGSSYTNYFNQKVINSIRKVNDNKDRVELPSGRINPFKTQ